MIFRGIKKKCVVFFSKIEIKILQFSLQKMAAMALEIRLSEAQKVVEEN